MKKQLISALLTISLITPFNAVPSFAGSNIEVLVNGKTINFDVQPTVINGRTMIPVRYTTEALGALVNWDGPANTVIITSEGKLIKLPINSYTASLNGQSVSLDAPATIIDGRTLVPARFIAESLGAKVNWDATERTVIISTSNATTGQTIPQTSRKEYSATEINRFSESVVTLINHQNNGGETQGSGFVITSDGQIATNYHVIKSAASIDIYFQSGEKISGDFTVIGYNENLDLAVIKPDISKAPALTLGNSDSVAVGQNIYAIGTPKGLSNTLSTGVVSALRDQYIQISAPISHGSSGGALFNSAGEVIGITSAGVDDGQNLGFAIPVNMLKNLQKDKNIRLSQLFPTSNQSASKMSIEEYEKYLKDKYTYIQVPYGALHISNFGAAISPQGNLSISCFIRGSDITPFIADCNGANSEKLAQSISTIAFDASKYYGGNCTLHFMYSAFYEDYTDASSFEHAPLNSPGVTAVTWDDKNSQWYVMYEWLRINTTPNSDTFYYQYAE